MHIGLLIVFLLACFLAYAATRPDIFKVSREAVIPAPADKIFPHVNDLAKWHDWSPWAKLDPNCKNTISSGTGKGQTFGWDGNKEVGAGNMTIIDSVPNQKIHIRLDFTRPFKATNDVWFTFSPEASGTKVIWSMEGKNNFFSKVISCFMNCEKMVGGQYEKGLENLKNVVGGSREAA